MDLQEQEQQVMQQAKEEMEVDSFRANLRGPFGKVILWLRETSQKVEGFLGWSKRRQEKIERQAEENFQDGFLTNR